jgi:hypothetical protein
MINKDIMDQIMKFLENNPYEYLSVLSLLINFIGQIDRESQDDDVLLSIGNTYQLILTRNDSAKSNQ